MFSSVKPRQISSLELHKYEINTRTPTVEQHLIAQAQSWPKLKSDCMFQTMFVLLSNRKYKFISVLQEIFQGKRYKIELLPDDDDGLCIVHQLTISKPMSKDMGKYTCTANEIQTGSYLDVEGGPANFFYMHYKCCCLYTRRLFTPFNHDFERHLNIFCPVRIFCK